MESLEYKLEIQFKRTRVLFTVGLTTLLWVTSRIDLHALRLNKKHIRFLILFSVQFELLSL